MFYLIRPGDPDDFENGVLYERYATLVELAESLELTYRNREDGLQRDIRAGDILVIRGEVLAMSLEESTSLSSRLRFIETEGS